MKYTDGQISWLSRNARTPEARQALDLVSKSRIERSMGVGTSARSDVLAAELRTARTKNERREARRRFFSEQRDTNEARFSAWLRQPEHGRAYEDRAMGEAAGTAGGFLVPQRWLDNVIHEMKEYDALLNGVEEWRSDDFGNATLRPIYSQFGESAAVGENPATAITMMPAPVLAQQSWPLAPSYASQFVASIQLREDAGIDFDVWVGNALGEALGRVIAPVAQSTLYSTISGVGAASGQDGGYLGLGAGTAVTFASGATTELAADTISIDTAAQMLELLDEAYAESDTLAWYMTRKQWAGILRQTDSNGKAQSDPATNRRSLYNIPVKLTSQVKAAAASTVSGPVLGDLKAACTLRLVRGSMHLLRSHEKAAETMGMYYQMSMRADCATRDGRAVVGVQYAAS